MSEKRNERDKYGVALVRYLCPICRQPKEELQEIVINSRLTFKSADKVREMNGKVVGIANKSCNDCKSIIDQGAIFIIGIDVEKSDMEKKDYYRSGHLAALKRESEFVKALPENVRKGDAVFMDYREMAKFGMIKDEGQDIE